MDSYDKMRNRTAIVVSFYWLTSMMMVYLNKKLLKSDEFQLNTPIFVAFFQCFVAVLLCKIFGFVTKYFRSDSPYSFKFDAKISREVLPLSFCFVAMIAFNNLCLRELGLSFFNIGRSLTTAFTIVFSYFVLKKTTSIRACLCCLVVIAGYLLGISSESTEFWMWGISYCTLASLFCSLNAIITARVLPSVGNNVWKLVYYNNFNSCILFIPLVFVSGDPATIFNYERITHKYFWFILVSVGFMGFLVSLSSTWEIQVTTPLTHGISGSAKTCLQTSFTVLLLNDPKSVMWWFSNATVAAGTMAFALVKRRKMKRRFAEQLRYEKIDDMETGRALLSD